MIHFCSILNGPCPKNKFSCSKCNLNLIYGDYKKMSNEVKGLDKGVRG